MAKIKIRTKNGETERTEIRKKNGKIEVAKRIVVPKEKKVYEFYKSPKGKKYQTIEELGAVERRGVNLKEEKIKAKIKADEKGKLYKDYVAPTSLTKTKLLPEKINRNNKRP
jgi:uncharacterized protein YaaN involved in tellurite resistance